MTLNSIGKLIAAFVTLILGVSLLVTISGEALNKTSTINLPTELVTITTARTNPGINDINTSVSNFTLVNKPTSWKQTDCPVVLNSYGNASTNFTLTTDYVFYNNLGIITLKNTTTTKASLPNATYANYVYCGDDYLNSSFGRTTTLLIPGLFALALLAISVGLFYSIGKDFDLI